MSVFFEVVLGMLSWIPILIWIPLPFAWLLYKAYLFNLNINDED